MDKNGHHWQTAETALRASSAARARGCEANLEANPEANPDTTHHLL